MWWETAFRGYVQGGIERHRGPVLAILLSGSLFGLEDFSHPEVGIALLPYYIADLCRIRWFGVRNGFDVSRHDVAHRR